MILCYQEHHKCGSSTSLSIQPLSHYKLNVPLVVHGYAKLEVTTPNIDNRSLRLVLSLSLSLTRTDLWT